MLGLLLGGCAAGQSQSLLHQTPVDLNEKAQVSHVPLFPQTENQCGPAALATTLNWAGVTVTPEALTPQLFILGKQGSLQVEMMALPRRYGILAYQLNPQLEDLLREVDEGHPVVVFQNLALNWYPQWHYAVVKGYDLQAKTIILHSGAAAEHILSLSTFEHTWARAGYWAIVTLPAGIMPVKAEEIRLMQAAVNLEKVGQTQAAALVYEAALIRWPKSLAAQMGRGNSYYALGLLDQARLAFYQATQDHPQAAPAFNNLAQVYLEQNRLKDAKISIEQAITLDSQPQLYRETMAAVAAKVEGQL